ncbi:hypothetical protein RII69_003972 [Vibrio parahaemolyticus]|nr:hypothetical protein [Vibrio parahaemolyticus]ELC0687690.1 hypothetical protein [Vibrio parahaemolyticus]
MSSRVDIFVELPEVVVHKVGYALARQRSKLPFRVFDAMTPVRSKFPYYSTMDLIRAADSASLPYLVKTYLNPLLEVEGYRIKQVVPEKAILDDFGYKSRQRYWGFIKL